MFDKKAYMKYLNSTGWKRLREKVLKRDEHKCVGCGSDKDLEIHHKNYNGNYNRLNNLQTLCRECHEDVTWLDSYDAHISIKRRKQEIPA